MCFLRKITGILLAAVLFLMLLLLVPDMGKLIGYETYHILSGSMEPAIQEGSIVFVKPGREIKRGDVISYKLGETIVTHRVKAILPSGCETKGDANSDPDFQPVAWNQIIGKVIRLPGGQLCIPQLGRIREEVIRYRLFLWGMGCILTILWGISRTDCRKEKCKRNKKEQEKNV